MSVVTTTMKDVATGYAARGWKVLPLRGIDPDELCDCRNPDCRSPGKHPRTSNGLKDASSDPEKISQWWTRWPAANIGVVTGNASGVVVLDIDSYKNSGWTVEKIEREHGSLPETLTAKTGGGGVHYFYLAPDVTLKNCSAIWPGVDVRADDGYVVVAPSNHSSGAVYEWEDFDVPIAPMPAWLVDAIRERNEKKPGAKGGVPVNIIAGSEPPEDKLATLLTNETFRATWNHGRNGDMKDDSPSGYDLSLALSAVRAGWSDAETTELIRAFRIRHDLDPAKAMRPDYIARTLTAARSNNQSEKKNQYYPRTDTGAAERMAAAHGHDLRFRSARSGNDSGTWFFWAGTRWAEDQTFEVDRRAKQVARNLYSEAAKIENKTKRLAAVEYARSLESRAKRASMVSMLKSEPGIAIEPDAFDKNPWLLNVVNCTLDLRTGELRDHRREDLITKLAPVEYDPGAECPLWESVLKRSMADNANLIEFLQLWFGHCLTGDISEQILPIFFGEGANGKSVIIDTIKGVMGDYACDAPPDLLTVQRNEGHPCEIADLRGRRLVVASETEEGKKLRVQLVKKLTGDSVLKGRFMRENFFEFQRTHKTVMVTNNRPVVRETKLAIWRRLRLIPFNVTIPSEEQDKGLLKKLEAERPGILSWMVEGCLKWRRRGEIPTPATVVDATNGYRAEQDVLQPFFDSRLVVAPSARISRESLWAEYTDWAERNHEKFTMGRTTLYERIRSRSGIKDVGFRVGDKNVRGFQGIGGAV